MSNALAAEVSLRLRWLEDRVGIQIDRATAELLTRDLDEQIAMDRRFGIRRVGIEHHHCEATR